MGIISITHFSSQLNYAERPGTPVRQRVVCLGRAAARGLLPPPSPAPLSFTPHSSVLPPLLPLVLVSFP